MLRDSADKIGRVVYVNGRNDFHGYGRLNMYGALLLAQGQPLSNQVAQCSSTSLDYAVANDLLLSRYQPQQNAFCPAVGPVPEIEADEFCFPIVTQNNSAAVVCL